MNFWRAVIARHWVAFTGGAVAGIAGLVLALTQGWSAAYVVASVGAGLVAGSAVTGVLYGAARDVFIPMWQDRHLRGYGFKTREQRAFLSIFRDQLRMGLAPGSVLDEASCVAGSEIGFANQNMQLVDIGQAARCLRGSRVADKFTADELVLIFRSLTDCDFDEKNIVELLAHTDDAAAIAQYLSATRDAEAALAAMVAGITPEYASAI